MNTLEVVESSYEVEFFRTRFFRPSVREVRTISYLDWLIDGTLFRDRVGDAIDESTGLERGNEEMLSATTDALMGREVERWHRFGDGRVPILRCWCEDLSCATVSARLTVGLETVQWSDVGWQVDYSEFPDVETFGEPLLLNFEFERSAYERVLAAASSQLRGNRDGT